MAHGNQIGSSFGSADARKPRYFQRISFRILRQLLEYAWFDSYESVGGSGSFAVRFGRDIHHGGAAFFVVVGEFFHREHFHLRSTRMSSPAAHSSRSGSVTRKALQRAS